MVLPGQEEMENFWNMPKKPLKWGRVRTLNCILMAAGIFLSCHNCTPVSYTGITGTETEDKSTPSQREIISWQKTWLLLNPRIQVNYKNKTWLQLGFNANKWTQAYCCIKYLFTFFYMWIKLLLNKMVLWLIKLKSAQLSLHLVLG